MLVVPLFLADPPGGADASHRICSPGGYEFWRVSAVDDEANVELSVGFFDGHPSLHAYLCRYRQYRRRPTRNAPPIPRDFPVVEISVRASHGRKFAEVQVLGAGSLRASSERLEIIAGSHSLRRNADNSITLRIEHRNGHGELVWHGHPALVSDEEVEKYRDSEGSFSAASPTRAGRPCHGEHIYRSDPQCIVTGTIHLKPPAPLEPRTILFSGHGSVEHRWRPEREA